MNEIKSSEIKVILNWDKRYTSGRDFDVDLSCLLLNSKKVVSQNKNLVFFNNKKSSDLSVCLIRESSDGNDEDDEEILINLNMVDSSVEYIVFVVSIFDESGNVNFGQIPNVSIAIKGDNIADSWSVNLSEDLSTEKIVIPFEMLRYNNKFFLKKEVSLISSSFAKLINFFGVGIKR